MVMNPPSPVVSEGHSAAEAAETDLRASARQYWTVLGLAVFILWFVFADYIQLARIQSDGHMCLAIDDGYITMAVAKNLAQHGTWGIQPDQFTPLASSPGWVLLMALIFKFVSPSEWVPLAMNLFCATALFVLTWGVFRAFRVRAAAAFLGLLAILVLTPIVPVSLMGLEHILQTAVDLGYIFAVAMLLGEDTPQDKRRMAYVSMLLLSPILTLVRYEGAFIVAVAGCLLLARKRYATAILTGLLAALPIVVSGVIFVRKGWFFFPTTLIQKGNYPISGNPLQYLVRLVEGVYANLHISFPYCTNGTHLAVLMGLVLFLLVLSRQPVFASRLGVMSMLFIGTAVLHLAFARITWFYRYEAYLICVGVVIVVSLAGQLPLRSLLQVSGQPRWPAAAVLIVSILLIIEPLLDRAYSAHSDIPVFCRNTWEQQYQMGRFLQKYYPHTAVAANDIGAVNYFGDIHCLDLLGLGNMEVTRRIRAKHYGAADIRELSRAESVKIALVYEDWLNGLGGVPREWVKTGDWTISDNKICGDPTVSIFAVDPTEAPALRAHLIEFAGSMPKSVAINVYK
jgi:hypothetical protein